MSCKFITPLDVKLIDEAKNLWELQTPLAYDSDVALRVIAVPAGFVTDFASVPRAPVIYWLVGDKARSASVVHDYLYATGMFSRECCDEIFLEAMEATGISAWRRYPMYWAVRQFGWMFYNKPKKYFEKE